jgi:hypothetical protein
VRQCKRRIPEVEVATKEVQEERVSQLNEKEVVEGDYVLYWGPTMAVLPHAVWSV